MPAHASIAAQLIRISHKNFHMIRVNSYFIGTIFLILLVLGCTRDEIMLPVEPMEPVEPIDMMMDTMTLMDTMAMMIDTTMMVDTMMMMDTMVVPTGPTIWEGEELSFILADNSDHTLPDNQDMLTPNVIITRSVTGGEIFNFAAEEVFTKEVSPIGTEWAPGRTADGVENLDFTSFRNAVGGTPRRSVGEELVAHLIEDDIYLNVTITSWSDRMQGGFGYLRSTPN